jgi:DNA-binding response OmpR family regulator
MRILIVEDEARIRAFLARAFEAEGFAVDAVGEGEEGLSFALTTDYDLVILDLMLPGRDGLVVLNELLGAQRLGHQAPRIRARGDGLPP